MPSGYAGIIWIVNHNHMIVSVQLTPVDSHYLINLTDVFGIAYTGRVMKRLRIQVARKQRGWSQTQLGARARVSATDVSKIETGRFLPYPVQVKRLARALKLKPEELLEEVEIQGFDRRAG